MFSGGMGVIVHFKGGARARDSWVFAKSICRFIYGRGVIIAGEDYIVGWWCKGGIALWSVSLSVAPLECPNSYCLRLKRIVFCERLCLFSRVLENVKDLPEA